jgi:hypothetical protein
MEYLQLFLLKRRRDIQHNDIQYNDAFRSLTTLSSVAVPIIEFLWYHDIQHNNIQHNGTHHKNIQLNWLNYDIQHKRHSA